MPVNHHESVARRKVNGSPAWRLCKWELIGETRDVLIHGSVPGTFVSGPRKGQAKWMQPFDASVVTHEETVVEFARYELETGNCGDCGGDTRIMSGWSSDTGTRYIPCKRWAATGKARAVLAA